MSKLYSKVNEVSLSLPVLYRETGLFGLPKINQDDAYLRSLFGDGDDLAALQSGYGIEIEEDSDGDLAEMPEYDLMPHFGNDEFMGWLLENMSGQKEKVERCDVLYLPHKNPELDVAMMTQSFPTHELYPSRTELFVAIFSQSSYKELAIRSIDIILKPNSRPKRIHARSLVDPRNPETRYLIIPKRGESYPKSNRPQFELMLATCLGMSDHKDVERMQFIDFIFRNRMIPEIDKSDAAAKLYEYKSGRSPLITFCRALAEVIYE